MLVINQLHFAGAGRTDSSIQHSQRLQVKFRQRRKVDIACLHVMDIATDHVTQLGRQGIVDDLFYAMVLTLELGRKGTIAVNDDMQSSIPTIYAGGDIVRGGATVILAMGDGRRAAAAMDRQLRQA